MCRSRQSPRLAAGTCFPAIQYCLHSKSSQALQELKVESIPRYLLYDKAGKLAYYKVPGPHENELEEALERLLK